MTKFSFLCDELERWQNNYNRYCDLFYTTEDLMAQCHYEYLMELCQMQIEMVEKKLNNCLTW